MFTVTYIAPADNTVCAISLSIMLTVFHRLLLGACMLASVVLTACQKDAVTSMSLTKPEAARIRENHAAHQYMQVNQELLQSMAADANVRALFLDSYQFAAEYEDAIKAMSASDRQAYFAKESGKVHLSQHPDFLVRTHQQMTDFYAAQALRSDKMHSDFPEYQAMEESEQSVFTAQLVDLVTQEYVAARPGGKKGPCSAGYSACMGGCGSSSGTCADACWAGLGKCLEVMYGV